MKQPDFYQICMSAILFTCLGCGIAAGVANDADKAQRLGSVSYGTGMVFVISAAMRYAVKGI